MYRAARLMSYFARADVIDPTKSVKCKPTFFKFIMFVLKWRRNLDFRDALLSRVLNCGKTDALGWEVSAVKEGKNTKKEMLNSS